MTSNASNRGGANKFDSDELLVFGYACKLFRDDETALEVERTLMPWSGHSDNLIDRFDGRGHLLDLKPFDSANAENTTIPESEMELEAQLDYERYCDLYTSPDVDTEALQEEEVKRFTEEIARSERDGHNYNAVGFSYDNGNKTELESYDPAQPTEDLEPMGPRPPPDMEQAMLEPFIPPTELVELMAPSTVMPALKRQQQIIERTAAFVARSGEQMEIKMKMDKSNDVQFAFLTFGHELNSYYKQLVRLIKAGKHKPVIVDMPQRPAQEDSEESDDDDEDGGYLHPSLLTASNHRNKFSLHPSLSSSPYLPQPQVNVYETSYGRLLERLKPIVAPKIEKPATPPEGEEGSSKNGNNNQVTSGSSHQGDVKVFSTGRVVPPPPDVKVYVDKLADYVARNGPAFEDKVRQRDDDRFDFVKPSSMYYAYYRQRVAVSQKAWLEKMQQKIKFELHQKSSSGSTTGSHSQQQIDTENSFYDEINPSDSNDAHSSVASDKIMTAVLTESASGGDQQNGPTPEQVAEQKRKEEEQQRLSRLLSLARERYAKIQSERKLQPNTSTEQMEQVEKSPPEQSLNNDPPNTLVQPPVIGPLPPPPVFAKFPVTNLPSRGRPSSIADESVNNNNNNNGSNYSSDRRKRRQSSSSSRSSRDRRRRSRSRSPRRHRRNHHRRDHHDRHYHRDSSSDSRRRSKRDRSRSRSRSRSRQDSRRRDVKSLPVSSKSKPLATEIVEGPSLPPKQSTTSSDLPGGQPSIESPPQAPLPAVVDNSGNGGGNLSEEEVWRQLEMLDDGKAASNDKNGSGNGEGESAGVTAAIVAGNNDDEVVLVLGSRSKLAKSSNKAPIVSEPVKLGEEMKAINVLQRLKALRRQEDASLAIASIVSTSQVASPVGLSPAGGIGSPRIPGSVRATPTLLKAQEDIKNSILSKLRQSFQS